MGFASAYLEARSLYPEIVGEEPDRNTGIIVVIPSYNEPGICRVLDSLASCEKVPCAVEVIVVVNAPQGATPEALHNNELTIREIEAWKKNNKCFFRLFVFNAVPVPLKAWGVGPARKTGMDEAVRRFDKTDKPDGVILNLDADCTVKSNYFTSVYSEFLMRKERAACSICFEHPLSGNEYPEDIYRSITLYELHLRFYYQGLVLSGFPDVFHTVGSATGVKALAYVKAGGMNRKQAGEDFYFIQKLIPAGGYFSLNSTSVYPSPRTSSRVPFGTGAAISRLTTGTGSGLLTYNLTAFKDLQRFFGSVEIFYRAGESDFSAAYRSLPLSIRSVIEEPAFRDKITEIKYNTSGYPSFRKRFFTWFNMFRIIKYLNLVHSSVFVKQPVPEAAAALLKERGIVPENNDPLELLKIYRAIEQGG